MDKDFLKFLSALVLLLGGFFCALGAFAHYYGQYQCANYARITGKATQWAALDTCYIQTAEGWQRWDEYKIRATASEGLK
jgi:hypothetical protein